MKKNFLFLIVSVIFASAFFSSCQKEQITENEAEVVNDVVKNVANSTKFIADGMFGDVEGKVYQDTLGTYYFIPNELLTTNNIQLEKSGSHPIYIIGGNCTQKARMKPTIVGNIPVCDGYGHSCKNVTYHGQPTIVYCKTTEM